MLMMLCSSFSNSNTRGVTSLPPLNNLIPRLKVLGQVVEKETRHIFISLFLVQGRGWYGVYSSFTTIVHISQIT
jgi:exosome complex RNA-binding protein Csl4